MKKFLLLFNILLSFVMIESSSINASQITKNREAQLSDTSILSISQRPQDAQDAIEQSFQELLEAPAGVSAWGYNGEEKYEIFGDDHRIAQKIITEAPLTQTEFYFMDIGAGDFQWGRSLAQFINSLDLNTKREVRAHIIGIRGERTLGEEIQKSGRCTLYEFGGFAIENLLSIFNQKLPGIEGKIDMVVSRWTLRHLVDPVGTFVQFYNMLRPGTGMAFFDGFLFSVISNGENPKEITWNDNSYTKNLLALIGSPFLIQRYNDARSFNRYVLRKADDQLCQLPMQYIKAHYVAHTMRGHGYVTEFKIEENALSKLEAQISYDEWLDVQIEEEMDLFGKKIIVYPSVKVIGDDALFDWFINSGMVNLYRSAR